MAEYQRAFEVKSKVRNYHVNAFDDFNSFVDYASTVNLLLVDKSLEVYFKNMSQRIYYIESTERTKSWENLKDIIDIFISNNITKESRVLIIGGGVLQDAASFCCSIFNRGIEYEYVPSTLLSMVDSCIGGKTSINYGHFKNKLGNFYPPKNIFIVNKFISTLPEVEIYSGLGEIFKFQILQFNIDNFEIIDKNNFEIENKFILDCLKFKASIIEIDEFDTSLRLTLNFGHTFGHAIESLANYKVPHGIGVVWGLTIANEISFQMGLMTNETKLRIENHAFNMVSIIKWNIEWFNFQELYARIKMDKKNTNVIRMILMDESNKVFVLKEVDPEIMINSMNIVNSRLNLI
jgi:3-dehydroquinate synthase